MATTKEDTSAPESSKQLYEKLEQYPWSSDVEFQSGLRAIVDASPSENAEALELQARCYYFSRKYGVQIELAKYQEWRRRRAVPPSAPLTDIGAKANSSQTLMPDKPPYPISFNRLVELITEGKDVPGIKEIPNTILEGRSSESVANARTKPWEKSNESIADHNS